MERSGGALVGTGARRRVLRQCHYWRWLSRDSKHELAKEKHRMIESSTANSPRVKSRAWDGWKRCCPRYGGRWWRGRVSSSWRRLGSAANAAKGMDGGSCARHPAYIALEWLQVRKVKIGDAGFSGGKQGKRRWRRLVEEGGFGMQARDVSERQRGEGKRLLVCASWACG
jgi:hypothetical protein